MIRLQYKSLFLSAALVLTATQMTKAGSLLQQDFNGPEAWPQLSTIASGPGIKAHAERGLVGTIDSADTTAASGAVLLSVHEAPTSKTWNTSLISGLLPVKTKETDLGKLTLSFDHSVSSVRPITVRLESYDANKKRTGGLEGSVYPAAADFYVRAALDLSTLKAFGPGAFRSTDPFVRVSFQINNLPAGATEASKIELRIDNVAYASPTFYVSPNGNDTHDGLSEKTALADPQKAVDRAKPGDIILLMNGTYHRAPTSSIHDGIVTFRRGGTSAAWIVLKNYPGQHPILNSDAWNTIKVGRGSTEAHSQEPALCYLEVRGLHIHGNADLVKEKYASLLDQPEPMTNGNGISVDARNETNVPHHLRFADNLVEYCSGGGITSIEGDWVTIEHNTIRNNCWWMIYAGSGISLLGTSNFDTNSNIYKDLIRDNVVSGNQCFMKWGKIGKYSDGNGIIIDSNYKPQHAADHVPVKSTSYLGRTLIQNNLSFNNGGSGIHSFSSHQVDIINNTAYLNGASPALRWGQIFVQVSDDVQIKNNILVSRPDQPINSIGTGGGDQRSTKITRSNNLYYGGITPTVTGPDDLIADPQFVNASLDAQVADFHVRSGSPALKSGWQGPLVPLQDLTGKPRPVTSAPDRGPYQQ